MPPATCLRCGVLTDSLAASELCDTCLSGSDETRQLDGAGDTNSLRPPDGSTQEAGVGGTFGLLPAGGYRYEEELGGGGMGVVYKAVRVATEETVAVKKLQPDCYTPIGLRRFVAEARALAAVDHPNVVRLLDFVPDPADPHLVMEFVPGRPLSKLLKDGGPLPPDRAAGLMADAARGVAAAHAAGVIHRDLKPGNLLVTPDGRVKVADFGLGKRLDADDGVTQTGQMAGGTPGYMAPEQVDESLGPPGPAADVWGLGACLYHALAGTPPFPSGRSHLTRVLTGRVVPPRATNPAVPAVLDAIVLKCLEKDPAARYPSAAAVADDLGRFLRGESTVARPLPWAVKCWRRGRAAPRGVVLAWLVATAVVAAVTAAALIPKWKGETPPDPTDEHALLREQFLAGEEVTLVPEKGLPKWSEWVLGRSDITESPNRDGSAYVQPIGTGVLKLFDPPSDSYTASFELLHVNPHLVNDPDARVGVMLFHQHAAAGPATIDAFQTVTFRDMDEGVFRGKDPTPRAVDVETWVHYRPQPGTRAGTDHHLFAQGITSFLTDPRKDEPKWRRIVVKVSPEECEVWWCEDVSAPAAADKLAATFTAAQLRKEFLKRNEQCLKDQPQRDPNIVPNTWQPSGGLGVWAASSGLSFRNVTVRLTPPPAGD